MALLISILRLPLHGPPTTKSPGPPNRSIAKAARRSQSRRQDASRHGMKVYLNISNFVPKRERWWQGSFGNTRVLVFWKLGKTLSWKTSDVAGFGTLESMDVGEWSMGGETSMSWIFVLKPENLRWESYRKSRLRKAMEILRVNTIWHNTVQNNLITHSCNGWKGIHSLTLILPHLTH